MSSIRRWEKTVLLVTHKCGHLIHWMVEDVDIDMLKIAQYELSECDCPGCGGPSGMLDYGVTGKAKNKA